MEIGALGDQQDFVPKTWKGRGNYWTGRGTDGSVLVRWSLGRSDGRRGELEVWYEDDHDQRVSSVRISLPDGLTPSVLSRLVWSRFLSIADNAHVLWNSDRDVATILDTGEFKALERSIDARARRKTTIPRRVCTCRPGRRGHPDSFYEQIAREYLSLRASGRTNPTAEIAKAHYVSRNTAAGWVSGARKRGNLPPGRPGRAG